MIEREVRTVCRNAQELLDFHERFLDALRSAVNATGFQEAFSPDGEEGSSRGAGEEVMEEVEHAIEVVVERFLREVRACIRGLNVCVADPWCSHATSVGRVLRHL